jgi:hypothetical protein
MENSVVVNIRFLLKKFIRSNPTKTNTIVCLKQDSCAFIFFWKSQKNINIEDKNFSKFNMSGIPGLKTTL